MVLFFGNILPLGTHLQNNLAVSRLIWQAALDRALRTASRGCCEVDNLVHSVSHVCEPLRSAHTMPGPVLQPPCFLS